MTSNKEQIRELCEQISKLRRDQASIGRLFTDDYGNWKNRKAERDYARIDKQVDKLDRQLDKLDYEND